MARVVLTNPNITINSVDLTTFIAKVELDMGADEVETTAFGSTAKTRVGGLQDHSISLTFHQDWATSSVEQTIYPLFNTTTNVVIKNQSATTTTTNPTYTATVLVNDWKPVAGNVGDLVTVDVTWPVTGAITKANS